MSDPYQDRPDSEAEGERIERPEDLPEPEVGDEKAKTPPAETEEEHETEEKENGD